MSYSFNVRGPTKAEVKAKVRAEFDKIVVGQPIHEHDRAEALVAVFGYIDLLSEDETKDLSVGVSGSLGWFGEESDPDLTVTVASVSVNASLIAR